MNVPENARLQELIVRLADGRLNAEEEAELRRELTDNAEARRMFAGYNAMFALLELEIPALAHEDAATAESAELAPALPLNPTIFQPKTSGSTNFLANSVGHVVHNTIGFFSQEAPFGFLVATIVLAAALWIGSKVTVSYTPATHEQHPTNEESLAAHDTPLKNAAGDANNGTSPHNAVRKQRQIVGRVTGEVDCRWNLVGSKASGERKLPVRKTSEIHGKQGADAPRSPVSVAFGDKLDIASGLLEITYDTGAVVTLQGPCTFNVERNGGFLAVGRLTGRLEKRGEGRGARDEGKTMGSGQWAVDSAKPQAASSNPHSLISNPSSLSTTHYPLSTSFVIATPTALVTDLGTEFGINVDRDKATTIHIIRGEVEATRDATDGGTPIRERLHAGQAIYIASLSALPQHIDPPKYAFATKQRANGRPVHVVFSPEVKAILRELHTARQSQHICEPIGIVASAYHHVVDREGKLLAENDRQLAFQVATDGVFGRGLVGDGPRSSFDTSLVVDVLEKLTKTGRRGEKETGSVAKPTLLAKHKTESPSLLVSSSPRLSSPTPHSPLPTPFVGLRYAEPTRFDRIKVFLGRQEKDGGSWAAPPRVFILKHPVDTDTTPPESDAANWHEVFLQQLHGQTFNASPRSNPGEVLEFALVNLPVEERTGYGWAIGGVPGCGDGKYISVTELRAYTTDKRKIVNKE